MEVSNNGRLHISASPQNGLDYLTIFLSYLFHPIFLIGWTCLYLLYINPIVFIGSNHNAKLLVILRILGTSIIMPFITVVLLKALGFIDTIHLKTQKERIIPYVACITFFFWSYYVSKKLDDPFELRTFLLALFLTASASLLINNYFKISMHALGFGGTHALLILMLFNNRMNEGFILILFLLLGGLVSMARLHQKQHQPFEIYAGYITGAVIQVFSWWFLS
jgi:hypothetical protein